MTDETRRDYSMTRDGKIRLMLSEIHLALGRAFLWVIIPAQDERLNKSLRAVRELRDLFESEPDHVHDRV
jgi:hypothetical protein